MKGMELSEKYYEIYVKPMLEEQFPEYVDRIAVGLVGRGSECFGFDDVISRDHDFEPGLCLWLTDEDDEKIGFALMAAYDHLPKEMEGIQLKKISYGAEQRRGVFTIKEFYRGLIGTASAPATWQEWFSIPEYALATAVNGKVFIDPLGEFSAIRNTLKKGYPRDVRIKKLAAYLALMAQSGQYNYERCLSHGEEGAAQLALYEFINAAFHAVFLLYNQYTPFYKWRFCALAPLNKDIYMDLLELTKGNSSDKTKYLIQKICKQVLFLVKQKGFTASHEEYLEQQAIEISKIIQNPEIRRLHLMENGE